MKLSLTKIPDSTRGILFSTGGIDDSTCEIEDLRGGVEDSTGDVEETRGGMIDSTGGMLNPTPRIEDSRWEIGELRRCQRA